MNDDPRIEAAAKALYADNRSQWDADEFEWLHPDMQSRYRAVVAKVLSVADAVDPVRAEVELLRSRLATARADALREAANEFEATSNRYHATAAGRADVVDWLRGRAVGQTSTSSDELPSQP